MEVLLYINATGYGASVATSQYEAAYVGLNYVPGATTVPLVAGLLATPGLVNAAAYDRMAWDSCASGGPLRAGLLPFGVGCEADSIYNTVDGKMYLQRTACGNSGALLVSSDQTKATFRAGASTLHFIRAQRRFSWIFRVRLQKPFESKRSASIPRSPPGFSMLNFNSGGLPLSRAVRLTP